MARRPKSPEAPTGAAHLIELARSTVPPVHPAGAPFVAGALATALLGRRRPWIRRPALAAAGACALFFRHPSRVPPLDAATVVAPADGVVALIEEAVPPPELLLGDQPLPRVSTFLSIFDVHVQRVPVTGTVAAVTHTPGRFLSADLPAASTENERVAMAIDTTDGPRIGVVQIAGLIARRIVCDPAPGDRLQAGDTYGLIRFGSRVDVYLPAGTEIAVRLGQRTIGAETRLAVLPS